MKSRWRNIIIVSFAIIVIEFIGCLIFLRPYYSVRRVFDYIDKGQWNKALECYDKLNENQKDTVSGYLDSYAAFICQSYIDGDKTYEEAAAGLDAIKSIEPESHIFEKYSKDLNHHALKDAMTRYWRANMKYDIEVAQAANIESMGIQQRMQTDEKEQIMIALLNEQYQDFLDDKVSYDELVAFSLIVQASSYYDAYDYSNVIINNAACVKAYRTHYETLNSYLENEKYIQVMRGCKQAQIDSKDKLYQGKYDELYDEAKDLGQSYYKDLLGALIKAKENEKASELMDEIAKAYGDDFDLDTVKREMLADWQLAYLDVISSIEGRLKTDLANSETGRYILNNKFDALKPDSMLLYDINGDDVAELILFNSAFVGNNYIGCYVYTYNGGLVSYAGFVNIISFGNSNDIVSFPISFGRSDGEEYALTSFDGASLIETDSCQDMGGETYYVNGAESDEISFMSQRTIILAHQSEKNVANQKYDNLSNAEKYIMAYTK